MSVTRWICPLCDKPTRTFWHNGRRIFYTHGGDVLAGEQCKASGWIVEDEDKRIEVRS